jgi:hypothetical protein
MDIKNRFHTDSTFLLERLEHLLVVVICSALALQHWQEMGWVRFVIAFAVLDLIGYIPGAIAFRRHRGGRIPAIYHYLYNVTHSYLAAAVLVAIWAWAIGGLEWAMLAFPIHLSGDRGVFGNIYKPLELPFEPVAVQPPVARPV